MTKITIQRDDNTGGAPSTCRLTAVGHATGSAEVCAAVSGIVYALGGYLKNLEAAGGAQMGTFLLESGAAELVAGGSDAVQAAFGMAAVGLLQISAKYPRQLSVDIKNFGTITGA